jgi:hypothetical protein
VSYAAVWRCSPPLCALILLGLLAAAPTKAEIEKFKAPAKIYAVARYNCDKRWKSRQD